MISVAYFIMNPFFSDRMGEIFKEELDLQG